MTEANLEAYKDNANAEFWKNLREGWDWFEDKQMPPNVNVSDKHYVFSAAR